MPGKYRHIQEHEKEKPELCSRGMTLREIGEKQGFRHKKMRGFLSRYNRKQKELAAHGYFKLTQSYDITPSMSRQVDCYDNAMAKNFFGILKTECI